ncbi:MAG: hypothetical protein MUC48_12345, partial [Leptolyngbya sp. Prado105]|nr:hypothetical protein [Leptolyngbya sp. Prado105]
MSDRLPDEDHFGRLVSWQQVRKDADNEYTFRIYNTGDGLEYHPSKDVGSLQLVLPFNDVSKVSLENLLATEFVSGLYDVKQHYLDDAQKTEPIDYYEHIRLQLRGVADTKVDDQKFIEAHRSGTCSYASVSAAFGHFLGENKRAHWLEYVTQ